jgi:RNA recognition motif-containing protein
MAVKLYVGGLSYSTTSEALREHFVQCGTVESATVITDRYSGQSRGFGFVEMATNEDAQKAVSMLNGQRLDGRTIKVELANPQGAGGGGGGRGGSGMGGGRGGSGPAAALVGLAVSTSTGLARLGRASAGPEHGRTDASAAAPSALRRVSVSADGFARP